MGKKRDKLPMTNYKGGRELDGCMDAVFELVEWFIAVIRGTNKKEDESGDSPSE